MFIDYSKWFSIHSKVVELLALGLIYVTHILQAYVHFLFQSMRNFKKCIEIKNKKQEYSRISIELKQVFELL